MGSAEDKRLNELLPFCWRAYEKGNALVPIQESIPTPAKIRVKKNIAEFGETVYRAIEEKRKTEEDTGDLLSMLMAVHEDGSGMTNQL